MSRGAVLTKGWQLALLVLTWLFLSGIARAEVTARLITGSEQVEAGKPVAIQLSVSSDEGAAESPRLSVPDHMSTRGPSISQRFSTSISGFSATTKRELVATWNVVTNVVGKHTIGPARAVVDGKTITSNSITLNVLPAGSLPTPTPAQPTPGSPGSLFDDDDFFKGFPGFGRSRLDDLFGPRQADQLPAAPPEYQLEKAPDGLAFLNATVHPANAVVGQQVTLRVIAYGAAGRFQPREPREPRRADFFSVSMLDHQAQERQYVTRIGSNDFVAVRVAEYALFPLKAGKLEIGPMKMMFYGSNYISRATGAPIERESQTLVVDVREPPAAGRPLDYQVGDVGSYKLVANVTPRSIERGDSFSVVATLEGEGNPPQSLRIPEQSGLDWLQPTITEQLQVNQRRRVAGKRTFTYIVKAEKEGTVDLGELRVPYYDPATGRYEVAKTNLGRITVNAPSTATTATGGTDAPSDTTPPADELSVADLAKPRPSLGRYEPNDHSWARSPWLWTLGLGAPALAFALQPLRTRFAALASRRAQSRNSLKNQARQQLDQASAFHKTGDASKTLSALERALFLGIEDATGIKARALLRSTLHHNLVTHGLNESQASEAQELLAEIETLRFGNSDSGLDALLRRTTALVSAFPSRKEAA